MIERYFEGGWVWYLLAFEFGIIFDRFVMIRGDGDAAGHAAIVTLLAFLLLLRSANR